jgi:hypothetical protein
MRREQALRTIASGIAAGLVTAACTKGAGNGERPRQEAPPTRSPEEAPPDRLEFVLADEYEVGEKVAARLRNNGRRAVIYHGLRSVRHAISRRIRASLRYPTGHPFATLWGRVPSSGGI